MADGNILGLLFEISAGPSKAQAVDARLPVEEATAGRPGAWPVTAVKVQAELEAQKPVDEAADPALALAQRSISITMAR
jgi:hypothetical protein